MQTLKDLGSYTFPALLANSVKKFGKRSALGLVDGEVITYDELNNRSKLSRRITKLWACKKAIGLAIYSTSI